MENIEDEERKIRSVSFIEKIHKIVSYSLRDSDGKNFDMILKTNIEGTIVKWGHQVFIYKN